jgi:hypothetical protein
LNPQKKAGIMRTFLVVFSLILTSAAVLLFEWIDAPIPSQTYPTAIEQQLLLDEMEQLRQKRDQAASDGNSAQADEFSAQLKAKWAQMPTNR